jgi:hypothetical protein
MKHNIIKRTLAGVTAVLCMASYMPATFASADNNQTGNGTTVPAKADVTSAKWVWSDDYSEATVTFTYSDGAVFAETVKTTSEVTKEATFTETGTVVYTATYELNGTPYSETTEVEVPVLERIIHYAAAEPTCTMPGIVDYWYDSKDNKLYLDEALTQEFTDWKDVVIPPLGHEFGETSWTWSDDFTSATVTVSCGRCKETFEETTTLITADRVEPTYEKEGSVTYTATAKIDDQTLTDTKTVVLDKLEKVTHYEAVQPTCTDVGNVEFWTDNVNGKVYLDEAFTQEVTSLTQLGIPALGHDFGEPSWSWSDDFKSATLTITCNRCKETFNEKTIVITSERVEPTYDKDGSITYTATAMIDGQSFTDKKVVKVDKIEKVTHFDAVAPTCTSAGNVEYWIDNEAGKIYLDKDLTKEATNIFDLAVPALGHDFGEASWSWSDDFKSATLTISCNRCKETFNEETIFITSERVEPTFDEDGSITYTATAMIGDQSFTDKKTVVLDKLEKVTHREAEEPTCTSYGNVEYWIDNVNSKVYTDEALTQEVTDIMQILIPSLGHDLEEPVWTWSEDNSTAHVTITCKRCKEKELDTDAKVSVKRIEPTADTAGSVTYTAAVIWNGEYYVDTKVEILDKLSDVKMPVITAEQGDSSVKLTWTSSQGAQKYAVCGLVNNTWKILAQGYQTSYVLTKLTPGTNYKVAVIPMVNGEWKMDYSNAITVTPNPIKVPTITVEQGDNAIKFNWTVVEVAEKYAVCGQVSGKWTMLDEVDVKKTSYVLRNLKPGTKYTVAVIAKVGGKWVTDVSNKVTVTTKLPAMPTISYTKGINAVKLSWNEYEGADKYAVCGYSSGKWSKIAEGTDTSYTMKNLNVGSYYKVAVVVRVNGRWRADYSNATEVTPLDPRDLEYPVVKAQAYKNKFMLKWSTVDEAEGYALAIKQSGKWAIKKQFDANTTSFTSPEMSKGDYTMVIVAKLGGKWQTGDVNKRAVTVSIF